ncbi:MAG: hypothetical protein H7A35_07870 [Planctomycetales bacterium]|nr:hypothetical protein [bacterium]UNM09970.1 MAG: hypothetical protein H7A35_07870 [Planctomycetales bacterium]
MDSYNQGSQDPGGGYQPMEPTYGPPPKKKGFNWLACCGIGCGVVVIIAIIMGFAGFNFVNKIAGGAMKVAMELESTDAATIRAQAQSEDATVVAGNPSGYTSQWVAMNCTVMTPEEFGRTYFGGSSSSGDWQSSDFQNQSGQQGTMYLVEGGFMVIDSSNAPTKAQPGDRIIAYGKPFVMDFSAIPGMDDKDMQQLSNLKMFMAKEVDVVSGAADEEPDDTPPGGEETGSSETWGK